MESTDFLKMNVPGYGDTADILKISENFEGLDAFLKATAEGITVLNSRVEKLEKTAPDIQINSFTVSPKTVEKGDVVSIECTWKLSLDAVKTTINNIAVAGNSYTDTGIGSNKAYTLYVEDERGKKATANASVTFANRIYSGASSEAEATTAQIKALDSVVTVNKNRTVIVSANDQYIYYAYSKALGTSTFRVGILSGGFNDPTEMVVENTKGFSEVYYIYRSANKLTGTFEITVE